VVETARDAPPRPSDRTLGVVIVALSACAFGSGPFFVQGAFEAGMGALAVLYWRFLVAAVLSWAFVLSTASRRRSLLALTPRRALTLAFLGALYVGNSGAYVAAIEIIPVTLATIITYTFPGIVAVLSTRYLRRLSGRRAWVALGLAMGGVALAVGGIPTDEMPPLHGLALASAGPVIYAVWIVLQARLLGERPDASPRPDTGPRSVYGGPALDAPPGSAAAVRRAPDPAPATAVMTSATAAVFAVLLLATGGSLSPIAVPAEAWVGLLGFGAVSTAFAIQAFYAGVARVGGARAALISSVEPVYIIVLATLLLGETLAPLQAVGGALVIVGVLLAEVRPRRPSLPRRPVLPRQQVHPLELDARDDAGTPGPSAERDGAAARRPGSTQQRE
jgi:drug/metabolite transporter (DMT)-like permease